MEWNCVSAGKSLAALNRAEVLGKTRSPPAVGATPPAQLAGSVQLPPAGLPPVHRANADRMSIVAVSSVNAPPALTRSVTTTVAGPAGAWNVRLGPTSSPR